MAVSNPFGGSLVDFNVGLSAAIALIYPIGISLEGLSAQIDALLSIGLGPFQAELALQFNAALAAQATLTLQIGIGDPLVSLELAIAALAQLQAALTAALQFPPINLSLSAELSASVALAGALSARLGLLSLAIQAAIKIKLAGLKLLLGTLEATADLEAQINVGPAWAFNFSDPDPGGPGEETLADIGEQIRTMFTTTGVGTGGDAILPSHNDVYGIVLMCRAAPAVQAGLSAIIKTEP